LARAHEEKSGGGAEGDGGVSSQLRADRFKLLQNTAARFASAQHYSGAILKLLQIIINIVRMHISAASSGLDIWSGANERKH